MKTRRHHPLGTTGRLVHLGGYRPSMVGHPGAAMSLVSPTSTQVADLPRLFADPKAPWRKALGLRDQGNAGTCTASSLRNHSWLTWKDQQANVPGAASQIPKYSELCEYAWSREAEGTPLTEDSGCQVSTAFATMRSPGCAPDELWKYDDSLFYLEPPDGCRPAAVAHETTSDAAVPDLLCMLHVLANWYPVGFGMTVFPSMMTDAVAHSGQVPIPSSSEQPVGGHYMNAIGYDQDKQVVIIDQSWGQWGDDGFGYIPFWFWEQGIARDMRVLYHARDAAVLQAPTNAGA